jgi:hypothetical protein
MRAMKPLAKTLLWTMVFASPGCICNRDVTNDRDFASVLNHVFATRKEMWVYERESTNRTTRLSISPAGESIFASMPMAILPVGTLIRPVQLTGEFCESGDVTIHVCIENGKLSGSRATLLSHDLFLDPSDSGITYITTSDSGGYRKFWVTKWEPNPFYLEPIHP